MLTKTPRAQPLELSQVVNRVMIVSVVTAIPNVKTLFELCPAVTIDRTIFMTQGATYSLAPREQSRACLMASQYASNVSAPAEQSPRTLKATTHAAALLGVLMSHKSASQTTFSEDASHAAPERLTQWPLPQAIALHAAVMPVLLVFPMAMRISRD